MKVKKLLNMFEDRPKTIFFEFSGLEDEETTLVLRSYQEYLRYKKCKVINWLLEYSDKEDFDLHIYIEW